MAVLGGGRLGRSHRDLNKYLERLSSCEKMKPISGWSIGSRDRFATPDLNFSNRLLRPMLFLAKITVLEFVCGGKRRKGEETRKIAGQHT